MKYEGCALLRFPPVPWIPLSLEAILVFGLIFCTYFKLIVHVSKDSSSVDI